MKNKEDIKEIVDHLQTAEEATLVCDADAIAAACQRNSAAQSLAIKILSVFGGSLASCAFVGFLLLAGLYDSEAGMLITGCVFLAASVWANRKFDKTIIDTVSISFFIVAFIMLFLGFNQLAGNNNMICILFIIIACASLIIAQTYILSFVSSLIINGSILMLILFNNYYELIHMYVSALALLLCFLYLKEAKIITAHKALSKIYSPIRAGATLSFLAGLTFLGKKGIFPVSPDYILLSSVIIISAIMYLLYTLFEVLNITNIQHKTVIYVFAALTLLPTVFSPAISGAILLILLGFSVNYKAGFILGIIACIYFISQYYYDLDFTLLTKSLLLFSSGVFFILLYFFTRKRTTHEKI